jgi:hypothetical protein
MTVWYLIGNIWWNIPLGLLALSREKWLSEAEAWLLSDSLKFYTDRFLSEGRAGSGVYLEELDLKASFALETFVTVFQAEVYTLLACSGLFEGAYDW